MKAATFFKNKYVLYSLSFLGIINVLGYVALEDYNSMALFVVMLLLSRYFSKNWSLNIIISILVSSVVSMNNKVREGFKGEPKKEEPKKEEPKKEEPKKEEPKKEEPKKEKQKEESTENKNKFDVVQGRRKKKSFSQSLQKQDAPKDKEDGATCTAEVECANGGCNDGICGPPKKQTGFKNNVPPSSPSTVNGNDDEDTNVAAKMEDAYNSFNQLLGDGALKSMATETKQLVNQQKELMSTLNSMTPSLNKAKETLAGLKLPSMEKMTGILKRFNK